MISPNKHVSILKRNSDGSYYLVANIYSKVITSSDLYDICLILIGQSSDIRIVNLGILENDEFISEDVDNIFKLEYKSIIKACEI